MNKVLLIYPPFCTPASPPYSITNLYWFLRNNLSNDYDLDALDLNVKFHNKVFSKFGEYYKNLDNNFDLKEYEEITNQYNKITHKTYSEATTFLSFLAD